MQFLWSDLSNYCPSGFLYFLTLCNVCLACLITLTGPITKETLKMHVHVRGCLGV